MRPPIRPSMTLATTRAELAAALAEPASDGQSQAAPADQQADPWHAPHAPRAVVMTMGALHAGHDSLVVRARELVGPAGHVTVTIFVNPLQFGATEDLAAYPRTLAADIARCEQLGVDLVFAPTREVMYPAGDPQIVVDAGPLGRIFEGAARPTHFGGVLTVVTKLLGLTRPDHAIFGEKDYQQLVLIRQLVRDLELRTDVVGAPIVRDGDGLALSSRNAYLSADDRQAALAIPAALDAGIAAAQAGADAAGVVAAANATLAGPGRAVSAKPVRPDYVAVTDVELGPPPACGPARLLIAAHVGGVRLLDNTPIELAEVHASTSTHKGTR